MSCRRRIELRIAPRPFSFASSTKQPPGCVTSKYGARRVHFYISFTWQEQGWEIAVDLSLTQSTSAVVREFLDIWPRRPAGTCKQLAVTFTRLEHWSGATLTLPFDRHCGTKMDQIIDAINAKCGSGSIYYAGMIGAKDAAPTRISFTHVPVLTGVYSG